MLHRLHNRMPVVLPDKQAQQSWLCQGDMDGKCVPHMTCGPPMLSGCTGSAYEQHAPRSGQC